MQIQLLNQVGQAVKEVPHQMVLLVLQLMEYLFIQHIMIEDKQFGVLARLTNVMLMLEKAKIIIIMLIHMDQIAYILIQAIPDPTQ